VVSRGRLAKSGRLRPGTVNPCAGLEGRPPWARGNSPKWEARRSEGYRARAAWGLGRLGQPNPTRPPGAAGEDGPLAGPTRATYARAGRKTPDNRGVGQ
jgi:hypothetical protein